jgi:hypothetical protein
VYDGLLLLQAHGEVLQGWAVAQLRLAASQASSSSSSNTAATGPSGSEEGMTDSTVDTLRRMDTFLAANWQMYEEFAAEVLHKVRAVNSCVAANGFVISHLHASPWAPEPGGTCQFQHAKHRGTTAEQSMHTPVAAAMA